MSLKSFILSLFVCFLILIPVNIGCGGSSEEHTPNPPTCTESVRGLALLALLHPNFPLDSAITALSAACKPSVAVLPKVFGNDYTNLRVLLDSLLEQDKQVTVTLYGICGPCRPPRRDGSLERFRPDLDVDELEYAIRHNREVRDQYVAYMSGMSEIIGEYPQVHFVVIPELEDNQSDQSFEAMLDLAILAIEDRANVSFRRNRVDQYSKLPTNHNTELHVSSIEHVGTLGSGDSVSLDGYNIPLSGMKDLVCIADAVGAEIYLWRPEWQGIVEGVPGGPPDSRNYTMPDLDLIISLLTLECS